MPANEPISIILTFIGFENDTINVSLNEGEETEINVELKISTVRLQTIEIEDQQIRETAWRYKD